jgi:hypothetical protein
MYETLAAERHEDSLVEWQLGTNVQAEAGVEQQALSVRRREKAKEEEIALPEQ